MKRDMNRIKSMEQQNTIFRETNRQHDNTKKALSNLSSVGGTDEKYRQDQTYHATTEDKSAKGMGVVGKVCCPVFETVCRGWEDRAERLYW